MYRGAGRHSAKPQKPCGAGAGGSLPHVDGGRPAKPAAGGSLRRYRGDAALRAGAEDIRTLRRALEQAGAGQIRIFAKIENLAGVQALPEFLPLVDEVVIARGDLGNAMPLWELPRCQKQLSAVCRSAGVPFMVVTQMLDSMCSRAVPTRAEVSDIYNAVSDGASSVMLTGETAAGQYPVEAMEYLVRTARTALE